MSLERYIYILASVVASPGNQHCANSIGTLSFTMFDSSDVSVIPNSHRRNRRDKTVASRRVVSTVGGDSLHQSGHVSVFLCFFHVFMFYVGLLIVRLCFIGDILLIYSAV